MAQRGFGILSKAGGRKNKGKEGRHREPRASRSQAPSILALIERCPRAHFNVEFSVNHLLECTPCQANEITLDTASLSSASDCICDAGRHLGGLQARGSAGIYASNLPQAS